MAVAVILAAGSGSRFGGDKTAADLGGRPVWRWSYDAFAAHPEIHRIVLVGHEGNLEALRQVRGTAVPGGATRQQSVAAALAVLEPGDDPVLIHDGARPFLTPALIDAVLAGVARAGAAVPAVPVTDTIKEVRDDRLETLDRSRLVAVQTPQGARLDLLKRAHSEAKADATDDMALLEAIGVRPVTVAGEAGNVKITNPEDLAMARGRLATQETRVGLGFDIHRFSADPARPLWLGGVEFPGPGLEGHSDADALLHAATDALLGAIADGDIGSHFPNSDPRWKDCPSRVFLEHAGGLVRQAGWRIVSLNLVVQAEAPKLRPRADAIRATVAGALGIDVGRIGLQATTLEGLGALGRREGIAAYAVVTLAKP